MRLIDADALYELIDGGYDINFDDVPETKKELLRMVNEQETVKAEPSEEQVKEYCRKRNFVLITKELYCHLQYRWANNNGDVGVLSAEQNWNGDPIKR